MQRCGARCVVVAACYHVLAASFLLVAQAVKKNKKYIDRTLAEVHAGQYAQIMQSEHARFGQVAVASSQQNMDMALSMPRPMTHNKDGVGLIPQTA